MIEGPWVRAAGLGAAAVALALLVVTGWFGLQADRASPSSHAIALRNGAPDIAAFSALKPYQLTKGTGYDGFLSFAPDGKSIAFSSDRSGALEIYVQDAVPGSTATALTYNGRHNVQPAWSPDAQFIAYHEMSSNGIWIVPSRGGVARKISGFGSRPAWSPDGRLVAFQSLPTNGINPLEIPGALSTIWIVDSQGRSHPTALTTTADPAGPHLAPSWLPDSKSVLFAVPTGPTSGRASSLWSVNVETHQRRKLGVHERFTPEYTLAANGRSVYFQSRGNAIWWLPLSENGESSGGPQPTGIPAIGSTIAQLAISSDGRRMAWTALSSSNHVWASYQRGGKNIAAPLTESDEIRYGQPQPSSDGRVALVGSHAGSRTNIFLLAPGSPLRQLTTDPPNHGGPQWMPGEREIAFVTDHGQGPGYWAVDPETGRERALFQLSDLPRPAGKSQTSTASPSTNIAFTRDFRRLALAIVKHGAPNLWVASLKDARPDGRLVQRTFEREGSSHPAWSPDGRWLAYQCTVGTDTRVCVTGAEHGDRVQLTRDADGQSWVGGWAPDSDRVVFAARRQAVWNVATVSRSTSEVQTLTPFTTPRLYVRYPRWDGANDRVVFERSETTARIWSVDLP